MLNIPARDYPLRTEVKYWLNKHHIHHNSLVFRYDTGLYTCHEFVVKVASYDRRLLTLIVSIYTVKMSYVLIFSDEVELKEVGEGLEVSLVDHNVLAITDAHLNSSVVSVLDHHKLERPPGSGQ